MGFDTSLWQRDQELLKAQIKETSRALQAEVREKIAPIAQKYGLSWVLLIGSVAEERVHDESDIDLLVPELAPETYWKLYGELNATLPRIAHLQTAEDDSRAFERALKTGIFVYGK